MAIEHSSIDYSERIPNNVGLYDNRRLRRALESWQPNYIKWWQELGPERSTGFDVYLRTAISVETDGWANFGFVKMPEYRWGIFLAKPDLDRKIPFGDHLGEPVWQDVPGEYRALLRRLIVTQGDTEPASVEQQNHLGATCPSMYDLRNLFQINVEEGRHLWAMVYLLHAYFGRDGREEAELLLERHSGDADKPRILGAFNEPTPDWLSYYMFTYFTDRDGKYQLAALAESGFDPLARTCQFMLTEEAHHMFVGETGIMRVVQRSCEVMKEVHTDDPKQVREGGAVDLETMQKYINLHFSVSVDLFGQEISTNAATYFNSSLKGRYLEARLDDDHRLTDALWPVHLVQDGRIILEDRPALNAVNERLRDDYIKDSQRGLARWNQVLESHGVEYRFTIPHRFFNRNIGTSAGISVNPQGDVITESEWQSQQGRWLPTAEDQAFVGSLMNRVTEPEKIAGWIAPPVRGINGQPWDYEYVRFN
ncbi:MAG: benzoyl-CoA 2,3-epoxidase subunit BoxB [SAR202 cluster bacterium]|nr:benzoyl-CoA 2,3-epoxidase subunit BoxB [Dehalococcoidia bacterium]MQF91110.1 benzoyl-CoA 2,3-epoxidase subunit BoxB [SAR202 cluster bacterium]MQG63033.1 benzoyl-CoA 2,3-epoxidase subunit BoxB [SAR202 cluster bacterium]MQG64780.1 benzoyl-CoA 2,3-epoxidase subunit BoxB [SAR202 cluster bacterium]MQG72270.1 benzoyl-CoA 2,3-epoxidase subunit BoxB [SAR202 cluster bacterium]|tara:strand:- start:775 stop:2214 length:1440 start_codon:yes stop_codon:yes gene_type:complete